MQEQVKYQFAMMMLAILIPLMATGHEVEVGYTADFSQEYAACVYVVEVFSLYMQAFSEIQ